MMQNELLTQTQHRQSDKKMTSDMVMFAALLAAAGQTAALQQDSACYSFGVSLLKLAHQ